MNPRRRRHQRNRRAFRKSHWTPEELARIERKATVLWLIFGDVSLHDYLEAVSEMKSRQKKVTHRVR